MRMYIANCTKQRHEVWYRIPETPAPRQQMIDIGGQIMISGDLNVPQIESIVQQLSTYGMVHVDEVARIKNFAGLVYSLDKPVLLNKVQMLLENNDKVLIEKGAELRKAAAVTVSDKLEQSTQNLAQQGIKSDLRGTDVSIIEEDHADGTEGTFAEGLRVLPTEQQRAQQTTRPKAKRRGR